MNSNAILLLFIQLINALVILLIVYRKLKMPTAASLVALALSLALWSSASLLYNSSSQAFSPNFWKAAIYFCMTITASAQFMFALSYRYRELRITWLIIAPLVIMLALTQVLYWLETVRGDLLSNQTGFTPVLLMLAGAWLKILTLYLYTLMVAGGVLLVSSIAKKPRPWPNRAKVILAGSILLFLIQTLEVIEINPFPQIESYLLGYTLAGLGFAYGIIKQAPMEAVPLAREAVVEGMNDGWIVLDARNTIVDINPAAEKIVGMAREKVYGQPIQSLLNNFPNPGIAPNSIQELNMRRSVKSQNGYRNLNIRISPLVDRDYQHMGHLIVWRDVTERRHAEEARQRARDEMFVLINAISNAASNALSLDEFLSESIYQIIYPFRSQLVAIFLLAEKNRKDEEQRLTLASQFGLPAEATEGMSHLPLSSPLFDLAYKNQQSILIENSKNDPRIPLAIRDIEFTSFLVIPLITQAEGERKILGFLCMARKVKPVFSQDDVIRLTAIAEHIATLINSERRRKLAIALSERKRLERDLHDSVSQKLYGLVTLTEAAHAALEAGSRVDPYEIISRIGENARQAVKEMRLFLFQPQPVDVEKEGLVSVLHHRLAAVEGRANIKARFLADENVSLSKEKEVALYFIAQEALNNALRHAYAKSVTITLREERRNVILEIVDDGRGFNPEEVKRGGLGLRNMKDRASMINGKFTFLSQVDKGTRIIVTLPKD